MIWLFYPETLILLIPAVLLAVYAQYKVRAAYAKYLRVPTQHRVSAAEAARTLLQQAGVTNVQIESIRQPLGDHYDPRRRVLRLSAPESVSVAAVGVAAHEAGHALQHAQGYAPLSLRSAVLPLAMFGSQLAFPLFFLGLIFQATSLVNIGIILFSAAVLFILVTLPVEFNASRRAIAALRTTGLVSEGELGAVKEVLTAAALTYVASAAMALAQLLGMLMVAGNRRRS